MLLTLRLDNDSPFWAAKMRFANPDNPTSWFAENAVHTHPVGGDTNLIRLVFSRLVNRVPHHHNINLSLDVGRERQTVVIRFDGPEQATLQDDHGHIYDQDLCPLSVVLSDEPCEEIERHWSAQQF